MICNVYKILKTKQHYNFLQNKYKYYIIFSLSRWRKQNQKSTTELYREAAQMLGLSCTLSDSCRCLDCQVFYLQNYIIINGWTIRLYKINIGFCIKYNI